MQSARLTPGGTGEADGEPAAGTHPAAQLGGGSQRGWQIPGFESMLSM